MSAVNDLIAQVEDRTLRERLAAEVRRITKEKKFGLVFEEHLPEMTPIYSAEIKKHSKVALRAGSLTDLWRVLSIRGNEAHCRNISSGELRKIPMDDLVVVRQFGEPIFPALLPVDKVQNGPDDAPWHTLIEADNYHALQLLEYLYTGKVDCIYIDPPYNTGARDWKYNNAFVDSNDSWRHSKWLAMMRRRLKLAFNLLKHEGIMILTIDDNEVHHLRMLLEDSCFGQIVEIGIICIRNNPGGRATANGFSINHEYAIFIGKSSIAKVGRIDRTVKQIERYDQIDEKGPFEWVNFRKHGAGSNRVDRKRQFYPIFVSRSGDIRIPYMEWKSDRKLWENIENPSSSETVVWPIRMVYGNPVEKVWSWGVERVNCNLKEFTAKISEDGIIQIYKKERVPIVEGRLPPTWWDNKLYSSNEYGTKLFTKFFSNSNIIFPYPKSPYAVLDSIKAAALSKNNEALILDFFAGSGTTLHAVNLLNKFDSGKRRCILVTNNEVSEDESNQLKERGILPGQQQWEQHGICQSVTWPRSKYTILGKRDDGTELEGEYFTGKSVEIEKPRAFQQIAFASIANLNTLAKKKQLVALIDGLPQSEVKRDSAFVVSEKHPASILFDDTQADAWLEALEDQDQITDFYIVTASKETFDDLKAQIHDLLGPAIVAEEEKRPMRQGFPANLEYFRLEFLDKDQVALGRQFRQILPLLWLRAGAVGPRPELPEEDAVPAMVIPDKNPFAVLVDETQFADFADVLASRIDVTHAFLVTDSEEAFQEMAGQLTAANVIQLYRDYLENFVINKAENLSK
jgi:adenine-specific DNA-methyltransferase